MKKIVKMIFGNKVSRIWAIVSSVIIVFALVVSLVLTQNVFLRNTLNTVFGGERRVLVSGDPSKYQYYTVDNDDFIYYESGLEYEGKKGKELKNAVLAEANKFNETIAEEGIVLLKNDGLLPLKTDGKKPAVSVFGKNSVNLVYGGSGSGGGNTEDASTIYQSLEAAGYSVNPVLKEFYEGGASGSGRGKNPAMGEIPVGLVIGETPQSSYTSAVKASYGEYNDAAIVIFSRIGGEGFDLPRTMLDSKGNTLSGSNDGDHYLQLNNDEKELLKAVERDFENIIVVINCSTSMELGFLEDEQYGIDAALWIGAPGGSGINALGRILNGTVNPSGRLVDTYARNFKNDPSWANFSNNLKEDGNRYTVGGKGADAYFVEYEENIYVGYRYYETRGYDEDVNYGASEWYDENVVYPFGYGLSYTDFEWEIISSVPQDGAELTKDGKISVTVRVHNSGEVSGKDVVQLYYNAPYRSGEIEKPIVALCAFAKTGEILPGDHEDVVLEFNVEDMASYDYNDANKNDFKGYELDFGRYNIIAAPNANQAWRDVETGYSHEFETPLALRYTVPKDGRSGFTYEGTENRFDDLSAHFTDESGNIINSLSRNGFDSTLPKAPTDEERAVSQEFVSSLDYTVNDKGQPWQTDEYPEEGDGTSIQLYELINIGEDGSIYVDYNDPRWETVLNNISLSEMTYLIGTGNFNTSYITSIGKPKTIDPDGPAGFTNFMGDPTVYDTCFYAGECVIAATWNTKLVHDMGVMVGLEGICGNVEGDGTPYSGWYAPAVNIHRSQFSGRNFEYYSEDSLLSGKMGASVVTGARAKGVYTYVKHFVANDQETDRVSNGLIVWVNEQALREIYMKPFEIIVKEGKTSAIMSSFNRLGTTWAGGSYALLTEVLRGEWGFKGMVVTDYNLYDYMPADQMIRAGGDLNLTQDKQPTIDNADATQISLIRQAVKNILYTVAGSNAMNGYGEGVVYRYAMPLWQVITIIIDCVLFAGICVWGFFAIRKVRRKIASVSPSSSES